MTQFCNKDSVGNLFQVAVKVVDLYPELLETFRTEFLSKDNSFFLESTIIQPGFSRFSFMGDSYGNLSENITYNAFLKQAVIETQGVKETLKISSIFDFLKVKLKQKEVDCPHDLPFSFNLGYVGFFGYEVKAETIGSNVYNAGGYDAAFIFATRLIAFDHLEHKCYLMYLVTTPETNIEALKWFEDVETRMKSQLEKPKSSSNLLLTKKLSLPEVEKWILQNANMRHDKQSYIRKIFESLKEITNGESYEICLTNMIEFKFDGSPFDLYCITRQLTKAPHAGYFKIADFHIVCSSPERFLCIDRDRYVESKPIKGTRPRGLTAEEDSAYIKDLQTNEKDRAENLMIVDLLRNDLGQVCEIGSVHVPKIFDVETYSHVHQLVSTIRGKLKLQISAVECIQATFPGGSMTGAPKKRTMEIIDRLEQGPRGAYSGIFGWFGLSGACDFNIIIRSLVIHNKRAAFGVGGAITALSVPEEEFNETMMKARGIVEAIEYLRVNLI